jgi:hypothetical protein
VSVRVSECVYYIYIYVFVSVGVFNLPTSSVLFTSHHLYVHVSTRTVSIVLVACTILFRAAQRVSTAYGVLVLSVYSLCTYGFGVDRIYSEVLYESEDPSEQHPHQHAIELPLIRLCIHISKHILLTLYALSLSLSLSLVTHPHPHTHPHTYAQTHQHTKHTHTHTHPHTHTHSCTQQALVSWRLRY